MNWSKKSRLFLIVLLAIILTFPTIPLIKADGESWLSGWSYRKSHTINGTTAGAQTDYQMKIIVHYGAGSDSDDDVYLDSKCRTDFGDMRFTNSSGDDLLDYWIEEKTDSDNATIWVEVDIIPDDPDSVNIYVYYGKTDATTMSNGDNTFPVFIDMEDGTLNEWSATYGTATKSASGDHPHTGSFDAKLIPAGGSPTDSGFIETISTYDDGWAYRVWFYDVPTKVVNYAIAHRIEDASANRIYLVGQSTNNYYQYWDGAGYINTAILRTAGFHYFEYMVSNVNTKAVVDGSVVLTSARLTETALKELVDYCYRGSPNPTWFDDFLVRKFADPEPVHGAWGSEEESPPLPSDPNLLFGAGFNATSPYVELHWNHSLEDVQFFEVQNSSDGESWTYLGQSNTANYTDSQVVNGTEIYYKVRACNQTGGTWYNSSWTDVNFEKVYFILGVGDGVPEEDYSIIFLVIGIILMLSVAFLYVKSR